MVDGIFIFGAKYMIYVVLITAALYLFSFSKEDRKKIIVLGAITLPVIYLIAKLAGQFYFDPRPFVTGNFTLLIPHAADNGFPSDHVLLASAIASALLIFKRSGGLILWLGVICIGISRVYVGVHHPIDVLASAVISIAITTVTYRLLKKYFSSHKN